MFDPFRLTEKYRLCKSELCPCGSGLKYQECCLGKNDSPRESKKPPSVQAGELLRKSLPKCCMYPDKSSCRGKIKQAHALQNNKVISLLAGSRKHVYILNTKGNPLVVPLPGKSVATIVEVKEVGVNNATKETCFCDYHDSSVFAPIEQGVPDYDGSFIMSFLYAYRAFIFEFYKHEAAMRLFNRVFALWPKTMCMSPHVNYYRRLQLRTSEFSSVKSYFDKHLLQSDYTGLYTCSKELPYQIKFATYAFIALDYDLNGKKIKNTEEGAIHRVAITVFPEHNKSWILLSCMESERKYYSGFFSQVISSSVEKVAFYFSFVLPLYSENIVISPSLWESWDKMTQMAYTYYANIKDREFVTMRTGVKFYLKNAAKKKSNDVYKHPPKINLFME